jgi:hypothetical protein
MGFNKRGSHIDVILSFIIFISFLVFSYAILQPTLTTTVGKTALANSLQTSLISNLSGSNFTIISLGANQNSVHNCIQLKTFLGNANIINPTIIVRNSSGAVFTAYNASGGDVYVDVSSNPKLSYLFEVYYSSSFNLISSGTLNGCGTLQQGSSQNNYIIGQISTSSSPYIFDFNVLKLIRSYNQSYDSVKSWFNLSGPDNFGFNFTYQNQTIIGTNNKIPAFTNVYAEGFPVLYVTNNSSIQSGLLTIRVW